MKRFLASLADALDIIAMLCAVGAALFVIRAMSSVETGPEFMQIALFGVMLAVIPYCLAGAVHRIFQRLD